MDLPTVDLTALPAKAKSQELYRLLQMAGNRPPLNFLVEHPRRKKG